MEFFKYQSLGNDFVLFDWLLKDDSFINQQLQGAGWSSLVVSLCQRNFGIGADGVLILIQDRDLKIPRALIYNSDGSQAEVCFNGIRCIANHLFSKHSFPYLFDVAMGSKKISCKVSQDSNGDVEVETNVGKVISIEDKTIEVDGDKFIGSFVNVGNPHFVVSSKISSEWLLDNGLKLESHKAFPNKANIEFIWKDEEKKFYHVLVFERGCGITLACSTGAAAVMATLLEKGQIQKEEKVSMKMPGGFLTSWLDSYFNVIQKASSTLVFSGCLNII